MKYTIGGFIYGAVLVVAAVECAQGGHGTYLPAEVFSAPLSLIHPLLALFAAPILWAVIGYFVDKRYSRYFIAVLILHFIGVVIVVAFGPFFEDADRWDYLQRVVRGSPDSLLFAMMAYAGGLAVAFRHAIQLYFNEVPAD